MESHFAWMSFDGATQSFGKTIVSFAHFLIPVISVYFYEAPISLRIWIATKSARENPIPPTHNNADSRLQALMKDTPLLTEIMKFMVFLAVALDIMLSATRVEDWKRYTTYFAIMFIPAGAACVKFYRMLWLPSELWISHHAERGFIVNQTWIGDIGLFNKLASSVFALSITVNAFLMRDATYVNIILAILVHLLLRSDATQTKSQSVKAVAIRAGALTVAAIVVATGFFTMGSQIDPFFTLFTLYEGKNPVDRKWIKWMFSIMMSPLCFSHIIIFLRLDYAFANLDISGDCEVLPKRQDGSPNDDKRVGILVPSAASIPSFSKPYYTAAWIGYAVAILCLSILCSAPVIGDLPLILVDECEVIGFYLAFVAPPIICIFVMTLALWRGEFVKVWSYAGGWRIGAGDTKETRNSEEVNEVKT